MFSVGKINGGTLPNVIPDRVEILASLRTLNEETRTCLKDRIQEIVHGAKEASGAVMHLSFQKSIDPVNNDHRCAASLETASRKVLGDDSVQIIDQPSMGGERFLRISGACAGRHASPGLRTPRVHSPFSARARFRCRRARAVAGNADSAAGRVVPCVRSATATCG